MDDEEIRWRVIKVMLGQFPELRKRAKEFLRD